MQLRKAKLCLRLQHPREGRRLVPQAVPSGLIWFLSLGVVFLDTAPLRGAVYHRHVIIVISKSDFFRMPAW
jgi:hypothetical protein